MLILIRRDGRKMTDVLANRSAKDRRKLDFYPTPPDVTHALMQFLNLPKTTVWECACGEGHTMGREEK